MSGRSAYVRKEKSEVRPIGAASTVGSDVRSINSGKHSDKGMPSLRDFPMPVGAKSYHPFHDELPYNHGAAVWPSGKEEALTINTTKSNGSDDLAYARVRKPQVPIIDVSGIEKSSFRQIMDKKSESIRSGFKNGFSKKKKKDEEKRPPTSAAVRPESYELDSGDYETSGVPRGMRYNNDQGHVRMGPPTGSLPPLPVGPPMKCWIGGGIPAEPWNKMHKDLDLWDHNADTLIYFGVENPHPRDPRPSASLKVSSHIIEATNSRFLITLLREGALDHGSAFGMPPSPAGTPGARPAHMVHNSRRDPTPPTSERSNGSPRDGQISYEIYFPAPLGATKTELVRHHVTTRNVFAILCNKPLVGTNMYQALVDLHERLDMYLPEENDPAGMIIDYLCSRQLDDVRENPGAAAAILAFSERQEVRWEEGWIDAYVHAVGMCSRLEATEEFRFVKPVTRALIDRANLELVVRIHGIENRLAEFDYGDMWPQMSAHPPPARAAFERLRSFFREHYTKIGGGTWPPVQDADQEFWLTRDLIRKIQKDFAALYDYLVNRDVLWDCSEERSGRKWNIVNPTNRSFEADTADLPFTDILVAFDNRMKYPHIPHPYPLVPESIPTRIESKEMFKAKKLMKTPEDKMAERKAALAYTESTNIYTLGSDFVSNDLVDAFVKYEKSDRAGEIDPFCARRGRWVLIYGILQSLASVSVDTPNLKYSTKTSYHLNCQIRGCPPWKGANQDVEEAHHTGSHCWTIRESWIADAAPVSSRNTHSQMGFNRTGLTERSLSQNMNHQSLARGFSQMSFQRGGAPSVTSSDTGSSLRSPTLTNVSMRAGNMPSPPAPTPAIPPRRNPAREKSEKSETSYSGYAPGIEKLDEWPIREESHEFSTREEARQYANQQQSLEEFKRLDFSTRSASQPFKIKDFDDYGFSKTEY